MWPWSIIVLEVDLYRERKTGKKRRENQQTQLAHRVARPSIEPTTTALHCNYIRKISLENIFSFLSRCYCKVCIYGFRFWCVWQSTWVCTKSDMDYLQQEIGADQRQCSCLWKLLQWAAGNDWESEVCGTDHQSCDRNYTKNCGSWDPKADGSDQWDEGRKEVLR